MTYNQKKLCGLEFGSRPLNDIYREIQEVYLSSNRPWLIGYSGGKDSTTTLQLVWYALSKLDKNRLKQPIYVISSDTLVENPLIIKRLRKSIDKINSAAKKANIPVTAKLIRPEVTDSFWVNLLGRGYSAPSNSFRWCTDRLKIKPSNKFILERASEFGEVITVLGSRLSESQMRARSINKKERKVEGSLLSKHLDLPGVRVYYPIKDFTEDDVWDYLSHISNPWGDDNKALADFYRDASAGERYFVMDKPSPPGEQSRFGCWVCTLVERDKSMEALIQGGKTWLYPMLEIHDKLVETQDPDKKHIYRQIKRRSGRVDIKKDGSGVVYGPYKPEFRKEILHMILEAEKKIKEMNSEFSEGLITVEELHEIRRIWRDEWDWEDSLPKIYADVTGEKLEWIQEDFGDFGELEYNLLKEISEKHKVPYELVSKLLGVEYKLQGMFRRSSVYNQIDSVLGEEWRGVDEVLAEHNEKNNKK